MGKLKLSGQAKKIVKKLIDSINSEKVGYIAAIDPQTGEIFYGKNVIEAAKEGRRIKNNHKAVFFFVKVGYPSVDVLKSIALQGRIYEDYFPKVKGSVHNRNIHLTSSPLKNLQDLNFIADTGFSGSIVLDINIIQRLDRDYLGEKEVTLAGGIVQSVSIYISDVFVNTSKLNEVEIVEMEKEYLIGIALMRAISKRAIFAFDSDEIIFEN